MKTITLLLLLPLFSICLTDKLDEDNGFVNYKFGKPPTKYENLILEMDEGKTQLYSASGSNINVSGIKCKRLMVTFCNNQLSAISIRTDQSNGNKLLLLLKEKYGEPKKVKENYEWTGKKVHMLLEPLDANEAEVYLYSKEIYSRNKPVKK